MADGSLKPIEQTQRGELVWNGVKGAPIAIDYGVRGPELKKMVALHFGSEVVRVTDGHPMFTKRGLVQAKQLVALDQVLWEDGTYRKIDRLERFRPGKEMVVYNLFLQAPENAPAAASEIVVGPGLVTGDLRTQKILAKEGLTTDS